MTIQKDTDTVRLLSTEYPSSEWIGNLNPGWEQYYYIRYFSEYDSVDPFSGELIRFIEGEMLRTTFDKCREDGSIEMWQLGEPLLIPVFEDTHGEHTWSEDTLSWIENTT
jgi:hypothetical protein